MANDKSKIIKEGLDVFGSALSNLHRYIRGIPPGTRYLWGDSNDTKNLALVQRIYNGLGEALETKDFAAEVIPPEYDNVQKFYQDLGVFFKEKLEFQIKVKEFKTEGKSWEKIKDVVETKAAELEAWEEELKKTEASQLSKAQELSKKAAHLAEEEKRQKEYESNLNIWEESLVSREKKLDETLKYFEDKARGIKDKITDIKKNSKKE